MSYLGSNHFESNHFASNYLSGPGGVVPPVVDTGGGGPGSSKKKGWANELERLRKSREEFFAPTPEPEAEEPKGNITPPKTFEEMGGVELLRETEQIRENIRTLEDQYLAGELIKEEFERRKRDENAALEAILMALELDKFVILSII
jgi:hypothetical protein